VVNLQSSTAYTGGVTVSSDLVINGNGSTVALSGGEQILVVAGATLTLNNLTVSGGSGVAVFNDPTSASRLVGDRLTVANPGGTAIYIDDSTVSLTNSTIHTCSTGIQFYWNSPGVAYHGHPAIFTSGLTVRDCSNGLVFDETPEDIAISNATFLRNTASSILFNSTDGRKLTVGDCSFSGGALAITMGAGTELEIASQATPGLHTVMTGMATGVYLQPSGCVASIDGLSAASCVQNAILAQGASQLSIANSYFENIRSGDGAAYCLSVRDNSANITVSQSEFRNSDRGLSFTAASNVSLSDLTIANCNYADGIQLLAGTDAIVARCEVSGCFSGVAANQSSQVEIIDCYLHDNIKVPRSEATLGQGVYVLDNSTAAVSNTRIIDNENEGIYCRLSSLTVDRCVIKGNGWIANDGSGVYFDRTSGSIADSQLADNYLYGIHVGSEAVRVRGCELRGNRLAGISVLADRGPKDQDIQSCLAYANYDPNGDWDAEFPKEFETRGADADVRACNNLFAMNVRQGAHVALNSRARLTGNLLLNSADNNMNVYHGEFEASLNVFSAGVRNLYINNADRSGARNNDILPSVSNLEPAVDSMDSSPLPDFRENWWNDPAGRGPAGAGSLAANVRTNQFNTVPNAQYALFENYSFSNGAPATLHAAGMPFLTCEISGDEQTDNQILAAQASLQNLFPHIPIQGAAGGYFGEGIPEGIVYMWINASYETRFESTGAMLRFESGGGYMPGVDDLTALKYDHDARQWNALTVTPNRITGGVEASVGDIQGLYLLDPSHKSAVPHSIYSLYR